MGRPKGCGKSAGRNPRVKMDPLPDPRGSGYADGPDATNSQIRTAAAVETFNDSTFPLPGIVTRRVHAADTSWERPCSSLPSTIATGPEEVLFGPPVRLLGPPTCSPRVWAPRTA